MYRLFVQASEGRIDPFVWFDWMLQSNRIEYMKIGISGRISKGEIISRIRENYVDFENDS